MEIGARKGLTLQGLFGVFFYRSANPATLATLSRFLPVPAEALAKEFAVRRHAGRRRRADDPRDDERRRAPLLREQPAARPRGVDADGHPRRREGLVVRAVLCLAAVLALQDAPPPIGLVEVYGLRHVAEAPVRQAVGLQAGDAFPESNKEIVARLERVPGVAEARLEGVCCNDGRMVLFVGIRETGTTGMMFRPAPHGTARLPEDIVKAGTDFEQSFMAAVMRGEAEEDRSRGYSLMKDPATRAIQEPFPAFAATRSVAAADGAARVGRRRPSRRSPHRSSRTRPTRRRWSTTWPRRHAGCLGECPKQRDAGAGPVRPIRPRTPGSTCRCPSTPFVDLLNSIDWPRPEQVVGGAAAVDGEAVTRRC